MKLQNLLLLSCLLMSPFQPLMAESDWLVYDQYRRVPFVNDPAYTRCEFDWWIRNTFEPSSLYLNGFYHSSEYGTNDINLDQAWQIHPQGITIGVIDLNNAHGQRVKALAGKVSRNQVFLSNSIRLYPEDVAAAITNFVAMGFKLVVVTTGTGPHLSVSNACRFAEIRNALIFCAVPNAGVNIDETPDYPSSWAGQITSIVPITATDRYGNLYGPGAAGWGQLVVGAPGRNIIANDLYTSGTSSATPIAAGCMSILMQYRRGWTAAAYRNALWSTSVQAEGTKRIDALRLVTEF